MRILRKSCRRHSDEQLMALLQQGQASAFDELYDRYSQRLLHFLYRMLNGDEQKAQDFLQDICLTIIEKADYFNPDKKFSTWIFTIAGNMCKNEYRRREKQTCMDNNTIDNNYFSIDQSTETSLDKKTFYEFLHRELYKLDHQKKSVFLLRFQEQRSIKEISEILGCAEGTVKSRLFYTTQYLAKRLKEFKHSFFEV